MTAYLQNVARIYTALQWSRAGSSVYSRRRRAPRGYRFWTANLMRYWVTPRK